MHLNPNSCIMCRKEVECLGYLFLQCPLAGQFQSYLHLKALLGCYFLVFLSSQKEIKLLGVIKKYKNLWKQKKEMKWFFLWDNAKLQDPLWTSTPDDFQDKTFIFILNNWKAAALWLKEFILTTFCIDSGTFCFVYVICSEVVLTHMHGYTMDSLFHLFVMLSSIYISFTWVSLK